MAAIWLTMATLFPRRPRAVAAIGAHPRLVGPGLAPAKADPRIGPTRRRLVVYEPTVVARCLSPVPPPAIAPRPKAPYRFTEKRRAAALANLRLAQIKAARARKRDRSVHYASGFLHGYQVADPSRALPLSAATLDQYQAHLAVYDIGLHPLNERQARLARATALVSWKSLTGWRLYGDTEALGVWECLDRLAAEREAPSGVKRELRPARLLELVRELGKVFERWLDLHDDSEPLYHRLLQLLRQGVVERGGPKDPIHGLWPSRTVEHPDEHSAEELANPGRASREVRASLAPEPAALDPRLRGGDTLGIRGRQSQSVMPSSALAERGAPAGIHDLETVADRRAARPAPTGIVDAEVQAEREARKKRRARERQRYAAVRRARQAGVAIPGQYEDFVRRVEAALGVGGACCSAGVLTGEAPRKGSRISVATGGSAAPLCGKAQPFRAPGQEKSKNLGQAAGPESRRLSAQPSGEAAPGCIIGQPPASLGQGSLSDPATPDAALVREIAAALWQRLTLYRRYAEKLERELSLALIAWGTDPTVPYDRGGCEYARELAWEVVAHDFEHFEAKAARAATAAEKRLAAAFYAWAVERWGRTAECAGLAQDGLPTLTERYWAWQVTHPKPGMEMPQLDFSDTADQFLRAIELLRGAGVDVGKTIPAGYEPGDAARDPRVTPAKAGVHVSLRKDGFPPPRE